MFGNHSPSRRIPRFTAATCASASCSRARTASATHSRRRANGTELPLFSSSRPSHEDEADGAAERASAGADEEDEAEEARAGADAEDAVGTRVDGTSATVDPSARVTLHSRSP